MTILEKDTPITMAQDRKCIYTVTSVPLSIVSINLYWENIPNSLNLGLVLSNLIGLSLLLPSNVTEEELTLKCERL